MKPWAELDKHVNVVHTFFIPQNIKDINFKYRNIIIHSSRSVSNDVMYISQTEFEELDLHQKYFKQEKLKPTTITYLEVVI